MNDFRNDLLPRLIRIYGFEHIFVVQFAEMCEGYVNYPQWDKILEMLVKQHELKPQYYVEEVYI